MRNHRVPPMCFSPFLPFSTPLSSCYPFARPSLFLFRFLSLSLFLFAANSRLSSLLFFTKGNFYFALSPTENSFLAMTVARACVGDWIRSFLYRMLHGLALSPVVQSVSPCVCRFEELSANKTNTFSNYQRYSVILQSSKGARRFED